jgi:hypothetical protein
MNPRQQARRERGGNASAMHNEDRERKRLPTRNDQGGNVRKLVTLAVLGLVLSAQVFGLAAFPAGAADHLDGPLVATDGRLDINDVYVFHPGAPGSQDLSKTVFVMTVNPGAGVISGTTFNSKATYAFMIDYNGDAVADARILTRFTGPSSSGVQRYEVRLVESGNIPPRGKIAVATTGVVDNDPLGATVFAGVLDDPFFFDLEAFNAGAQFCQPGFGNDFFAGLNVSALAIEIPTSWIHGDQVGVWGVTSSNSGQFDRLGRPAINTVFIPTNPFEPMEPSQKDAFNRGLPANDQANFRAEVVDTLTLLYSLNDTMGDDPSDDAATVNAIADILLPDILTVDLSQETGFLSGRNLADDVIDAELALITEGLITTDCIDNDSSFQDEFPYLAPAN